MVWTNKTAIDGSIEVLSAISEPSEPPALAVSLAGDVLTLSWPAAYTSYVLQDQTNALSVGLSGNWSPVPGVVNNSIAVPVASENPAVFYRLIKQ